MSATGAGPLVLSRDDAGEFLLPADMLAVRFGWPLETFRHMMRRSFVASRVERDVGEDIGC